MESRYFNPLQKGPSFAIKRYMTMIRDNFRCKPPATIQLFELLLAGLVNSLNFNIEVLPAFFSSPNSVGENKMIVQKRFQTTEAACVLLEDILEKSCAKELLTVLGDVRSSFRDMEEKFKSRVAHVGSLYQ